MTVSQLIQYLNLWCFICTGVTEVQPGEEECLSQLVVNFFQNTLEQDETDNLDTLTENVITLGLCEK